MRTDLLHVRKCIHVQLDKDVHAKLRMRLFEHGLSMQDVFEEFARAFVTDDPKAVRIVEALVMRQVRALLGGKPLKKTKLMERPINELDHDALYSLIEKDGEAPDEAV